MTIPKPQIRSQPYLELGENIKFGKDCVIRNFIHIGDNCIFGDRVRISNFCNIDNGCRIGNDVNFQTGVNLTPEVVIGDRCFIGAYVIFADEKYPTVGKQIRNPVVCGKNIVIGTGTLITGGITIGDNAIIGMGSVVTKDVPPDTVIAGVPAKPVSTRKEYDRKKQAWEEDALKKNNKQ